MLSFIDKDSSSAWRFSIPSTWAAVRWMFLSRLQNLMSRVIESRSGPPRHPPTPKFVYVGTPDCVVRIKPIMPVMDIFAKDLQNQLACCQFKNVNMPLLFWRWPSHPPSPSTNIFGFIECTQAFVEESKKSTICDGPWDKSFWLEEMFCIHQVTIGYTCLGIVMKLSKLPQCDFNCSSLTFSNGL